MERRVKQATQIQFFRTVSVGIYYETNYSLRSIFILTYRDYTSMLIGKTSASGISSPLSAPPA